MRDRILETMEPGEPYTAGDLADVVGKSRRQVDRYLRDLADDGAVNRKKHSERRVSWWVDPHQNQ